MSEEAPEVWLVRHGETEWSKSGRHTGATDLPLTPVGESAARSLRPLLTQTSFARVLCSPRQRARQTAELAGIAEPEIHHDLVEWDYGDYEGRTRVDIQDERPGWSIWTDGAPQGESPEDISSRVDRVIATCRRVDGRVLLLAHGHVLRTLAARWIEQPATVGAHLPLDTAKVCVLSYDRGTPTLDRWNADQ
ncbi:MAG: histidine phosphatase family protein [Propionibacteriales bacterium]|nr:histidine phosphatase family protein [Propionibacteriales bacterium]